MKPTRINYFVVQTLFFGILLCACSPSRRLERLIDRHPELRTPDTLKISDTIPVPGVQADIALHIDSLLKPLIIEKERLEVRLVRKHDTLFVHGECKPDTIIFQKEIPIEKIKLVKQNSLTTILHMLPYILLIFVSIFLFIRVKKR